MRVLIRCVLASALSFTAITAAAQTLRFEAPLLRGSGWVHGSLPCAPGEMPPGRTLRLSGGGSGSAWVAATHPDGSARWIGVSGFLQKSHASVVGSASAVEETATEETATEESAADDATGDSATRFGPNHALHFGRVQVRDRESTHPLKSWTRARVGPHAGGPWAARLEARSPEEHEHRYLARAALVNSTDGAAVRFEGFVHALEGSPHTRFQVEIEVDWSALGTPLRRPFAAARQVAANRVCIDAVDGGGEITERIALPFAEGTLLLSSPRGAKFWPVTWHIEAGGARIAFDCGGEERGIAMAASFALEAAWITSDQQVDGALFATPRRIVSRAMKRNFAAAPAASSLGQLLTWSRTAPGGHRDHGDTPLEQRDGAQEITWSNGEFDLCLGLARAFASGAGPESFEFATDAMRHAIAIDIPSNGGDGSRRGLPWRHGQDHGIGGIQDLGHAWIEGWLLVGRMRGDPLALDAAFACADAIGRTRPDPERELELERSYAWPVIALAAAAREAPGERWERALLDYGSALLQCFDRGTARFDFIGRRARGSIVPEVHVWLSAGLMGEALVALGALDPALRARLSGPDPVSVARTFVPTLWNEAWDAGDRRFAARVRWTSRGVWRIGWLQGVPEAYALHGLLDMATLARDRTHITRAKELLTSRGSTLSELRAERWWNDLALAARCWPRIAAEK